MKIMIKTVALSALLATVSVYGASVKQCASCHGQQFEKVAMGTSKIVKDMSEKEIIDALKGYRDGTGGGALKGIMRQQVKNLDDKYIESIAKIITTGKGTQSEQSSEFTSEAEKAAKATLININENASDAKRIASEDLGSKKTISEEELGLRKVDLYNEDNAEGEKTDYSRPAPGSSTKFERAFTDAPPMIPHSVEGLLPITTSNNQCLGCHMPEVAPAVKATPIPSSHFTNYRPKTVMKDGKVLKEGKEVGKELGNTSDIKIAKAKKSDKLYQGRFNCTQCHAPQSKTKTDVANTFVPDFKDTKYKSSSSLADVMNEGIE